MMTWLIAVALAHGAPCTILTGGLVTDGAHPVATEIRIVGSHIEAVGAKVDHGDCAVVDLGGALVTPGLTESISGLGLVEIDAVGATRNMDGGGDPVRAALVVADAYDPLATAIAVTRSGGVTSAIIHPRGGMISGQAGAVRLTGSRQSQAVLSSSVGQVVSLTGSSRAEALLRLRELLADVRDWKAHQADWRANRTRDYALERVDLEALVPVAEGRTPLLVHADDAAAIEALVRFAATERVRVVILGGAEAWIVADLLAEAAIPVVVDPLVYGSGSFDELHGRADNAALLAEAGVPVILSSFSTHNARTLRVVAGNAVRGGMRPEDALTAITRTPAQIFALGDRGRVEEGAIADLVVWSGDPLEIGTHVVQMYIDGEPVSLTSRQTALRDRYRTLPVLPRVLGD